MHMHTLKKKKKKKWLKESAFLLELEKKHGVGREKLGSVGELELYSVFGLMENIMNLD